MIYVQKGWSIKYCLTAGIQEGEVTPLKTARAGSRVMTTGKYPYSLLVGVEFFFDKDDALRAAKEKAEKRLEKARKDLATLENLAITAKFAKHKIGDI